MKYESGKKILPSYADYKVIEVMTPSTPYGSLSPYSLTDENGHIIENVWQFSKIYQTVPISNQYYSKYDNTLIWSHPAEEHINKDDEITEKYWAWRQKGFECRYAIRYPVGFKHKNACKGSVIYYEEDNSYDIVDYIKARKLIYSPIYKKSVRNDVKYTKLLDMLKNGVNILISEVDGPHQESLDYYIEKYTLDKNFIEDETLLATAENLNVMLNDEKHSYGHGYCLADALLEDMEFF